MDKSVLSSKWGLIFPFLSFSISCLLFPVSTLLSQTTEDITITTYYPSPFGVYNELETNRFMVGAGVMPDDDGVVNFQQLAAAPAGAASNTEGALYYNTTSSEFRYHNGAGWQSFGGPCLRRAYTNITGIEGCPPGYQLAGIIYNAPLPAWPTVDNQYLCCPFCNDFDFDGNCD